MVFHYIPLMLPCPLMVVGDAVGLDCKDWHLGNVVVDEEIKMGSRIHRIFPLFLAQRICFCDQLAKRVVADDPQHGKP